MTDAQRMREAQMQASIQVYIARHKSEIPESAVKFITAIAAKTPAAKSYLLGAEKEVDPAEIFEAVARSDEGRELLDLLAEPSNNEPDPNAELEEAMKLPPAARMTWARSQGLRK